MNEIKTVKMNEIKTVKLTVDEWTALVLAVLPSLGAKGEPAGTGNAIDQLTKGREIAIGILTRAIGEERTTALVERQEGPVLSKEDTRKIVKELYPLCPGETRAEKITWAMGIGKEVFSADRFAEVLAYVEDRVGAHEAAGGTIDAPPPKPPEPPKPAEPPKDEVLRGGDGLYKPEGNLWLLPAKNPRNGQRFLGQHLGVSGEYKDRAGTQWVRWHRWPAGIGGMSSKQINGSNRLFSDHPNLYHNGRLKIRDASAAGDGNWFIARDIYGQVVFTKQIIKRGSRQE